MTLLKEQFVDKGGNKMLVYAASALVLLPVITLAKNYHINDRSDNVLPLIYAQNILNSCEQDAILFTSGDNDTFPVWCLQEVYGYRKDVRVVNLSLLNTDWYTEQMKNRYGVPMSLTDEQILWFPYEYQPGLIAHRPLVKFTDKPRRRQVYLQASMHQGNYVRVQDMLMDDIVIENRWESPIYFSAPPYSYSPLDLRTHATSVGTVYRLDREAWADPFDIDQTYKLYMEVYQFDGLENADVARDDNATGVFQAMGARGVMLFEALVRTGDTTRAMTVIDKLIDSYAEYWPAYLTKAEYLNRQGDTTRSLEVVKLAIERLTSFLELDPHNQYYMQDLGMATAHVGRVTQNTEMVQEGARLVSEGFLINPNNSYAFRKALSVMGRSEELMRLARIAGQFKRNLSDPYLSQILGLQGGGVPNSPF